jgi:mevalonate pyrophosphate decarboxylase
VKDPVSKAENLVFVLVQGIVMIKIEYKQNGKYFEFWLDGELKEKAAEISTLMQKVRKYKIGLEYGLDKFL